LATGGFDLAQAPKVNAMATTTGTATRPICMLVPLMLNSKEER
jgi:hypothetical protein